MKFNLRKQLMSSTFYSGQRLSGNAETDIKNGFVPLNMEQPKEDKMNAELRLQHQLIQHTRSQSLEATKSVCNLDKKLADNMLSI